MGLLSGLTKTDDVKEDKDTLGGGSFVVESGVYDTTIEMAYIKLSDAGAMSLNLHLKHDNGIIKNTLWIQSGNEKGNKNYYVNKKTNEKHYLPGFNQANALCQLTVGQNISALDTDIKVINLWDFDLKKEVPTKVEVIEELLDQEIKIGVIKQVVDKNVKNDEGKWVPSGQTREDNEIDKIFRASDGKTFKEAQENVDAAFMDSWAAKWTGVTKNKATAASASGSSPGLPKGKSSAPTPAKSLFAFLTGSNPNRHVSFSTNIDDYNEDII